MHEWAFICYGNHMSTDAELVRAWRAGDKNAGETLFERYYDSIARFFYNKAGDHSADLIQRTFLACVEGLSRMRDNMRFRSYLFGIAHNLLRKYYRDKARRGVNLDFDEVSVHDLSPSPSRVLAVSQEQRLLLEALRRIPLSYQVVIELFYWENMSAHEIAEVLDIPLGTAKTRIRRGRQLVDQELTEISDSKELLHSTLSDLAGWAAKLRTELAPALPVTDVVSG